MLFDTGATFSIISTDFIENSTLVGHVRGAGQTGMLSELIDVREIVNILIDQLHINQHRFVIDETVKKHFPDCDGVLGMELLSKCNLEINFCADEFGFVSKNISQGTQFITHRNKIFFSPEINGRIIENAVFDTGAHSLAIEKTLKELLDLDLLKNDEELIIMDSNSNLVEYETYKINSFELGTIKIDELICYGYNFKESSRLKKINQNGIIGKSIFDDHLFTFDFNTNICAIE